MTGIDYSPEMLDRARERAEEMGFGDKILWLCQDMREFELYGTVDLALCCLDGINHLTDKESLDRCLATVHNYLIPSGLFIFDVNAKAKFEEQFADKSYVMESSDAMCIWQNYYNKKKGVCDFYITLFKECADGRYERYDEAQREKMLTLRALTSALKKAGFELMGVYSDFDFSEGSDSSERMYLVAKCIKNN